MNKNCVLVNCDTDSIMIAKPDGSVWTKEEQALFLEKLNEQFPEKINWEHDGVYTSVVVVRSKNYALLPEGKDKIKLKGSSIKDQKKEPALREMMEKMIHALIYDKLDELPGIYRSYIKEALDVKDIHRWCQKKNISRAILDCDGYTEADILNKKLRRNETNVWDAVKHIEGLQENDRYYMYPTVLGEKITTDRVGKNGKPLKDKVEEITGLKLESDWKGDEDKIKLLERVYATVTIFESILDMNQFIDYSKSSFKKEREEIINEILSSNPKSQL